MATFSNADIDAILLEHVDPVLKEQFEQERTLLNLIGEGGEQLNTRGTRISSRTSPNASFSWFSEAGAMPAPGKEEYIEMKIFPVRCAVGFEFSGDFLDQIDTEENLVRGLTSVLSNYTEAAKKKISQALYGDGTGELGVVKTNSSATVAIFATTVADGSLFGARKVEKNGVYEFRSAAGVIHNQSGAVPTSTLSSKVESSATGTFDAVPTDVVATDIIVHAGSYNKSVLGLKKHVNNDTGAYQGQSRNLFPILKAGKDDAGQSGITVARVNKSKYAVRYRINTADAMNVSMLSGFPQFDLYTRLGHNLIRFDRTDPNSGTTFRGDFDVAKHGNSDWILDVDCEEDRIYGLDLKEFKRYNLAPFGTFRKDGLDMRMFFSNGAGSDKYTGWMGVKFNLGCHRPNANFVITNLSTTDAAVGFSSLG